MKKRSLFAAGLALCMLLSGCNGYTPGEAGTEPTTVSGTVTEPTTEPTEPTTEPTAPEEDAPPKTHYVAGCSAESYTMDITLDTTANQISGTSTVKVINKTDEALDKLCIRLYSASATDGVISNATNSATGKTYNLDVLEDPSVIYVDLAEDSLAAGATMDLDVEFESSLPRRDDRIGHIRGKNGKLYNMTFCFPTLAFYEDGQWNETPYSEMGESYRYEMTDYHVTLHAPEDYVVLSSGKAETQNGITTIEAPNVRELAIAASNFATILSQEVNGVTINVMALDYNKFDDTFLSDLYDTIMTVAAESVELFSSKVGAYLYDELDVIPMSLGDSGAAGMEMPGLVQVSMPIDMGDYEGYKTANLTVVTTTHEIGHQWFYCGVSNDAFLEPWLDESFTSYLEYMYMYLFQTGKEAMENFNQKHVPNGQYEEYNLRFDDADNIDNDKPINLPLDEYGDDYGTYVYDAGAWFLRELELAMGSDLFFEMLSDWYTENLNQIVTGQAFLEHLLKYDSGEAVQQIIEEYISLDAI